MLGEAILVAHPLCSHDSQRAVKEQWKAILHIGGCGEEQTWLVCGFPGRGSFWGTVLLFEKNLLGGVIYNQSIWGFSRLQR